MGKKRIILIAIAAVVAFICLGVIGVRTFVQAIYSERSCEWANIDNIEMHARIDIPGTEDCDCSFTVSDNVKRVVFSLDRDIDLEGYVSNQKLSIATQSTDADLASITGFPKDRALYMRTGKDYDSEYKLALDPDSRKLYVFIRYKR